MAIQYCDSSIQLYQDWISKWGALNEQKFRKGTVSICILRMRYFERPALKGS